jgi:hypothetical protein
MLLRDEYSRKSIRPGLVVIFVIETFMAAIVHFYLFLGILAVYSIMIALAGRLRVPLLLSAVSIGLAMVAYVLLLTRNSSVDLAHTQFSNDAHNLLQQSLIGIGDQLGLSLFLLLVLVGWLAGLRRFGGGPTVAGEAAAKIVLLAGAPALVCIGGLTITLLFVPSYSFRTISVMAPFVWLATGVLFDILWGWLRPTGRAVLLVLLLFLLGQALARLPQRLLPRNEEFRGSAAAIDAMPDCRQAAIPVLVQSFAPLGSAATELARYRYAYYLHDGAHRIRMVSWNTDERLQLPNDVMQLLQRRASGLDPCPVMAWMPHAARISWDDVVAALQQQTGLPPKAIIVGRLFPHIEPSLKPFAPPRSVPGAAVFLNSASLREQPIFP